MSSGSPVIVPVSLGGDRAYKIHIGAGLLAGAGAIIANVARSRRAVIVTQPNIARHWAEPLRQSLRDSGFGETPLITFPSGERHKHLRTITFLCDGLYNLPTAADRKTLVIALGGGVVGDMAGFAAAIYLRGLDYVQIPTTLLAMVDSSVGGKTGVDFRDGKNLVGAFHQPRAVVIDTDTLGTLPAREIRSGMAEVVKYGVIRDPDLLHRITNAAKRIRALDADEMTHLIRRSCEIKADVVAGDEWETTGLRAILNYGHTIGHALEAATRYRRYKHGEAIAIGMIAAARIGEEAGITPPDVAETLKAALTAQHLPVALPADIGHEELVALTTRDKKAEAGKARFVLARKVGEVALYSDVADRAVYAGLRAATLPAVQ